MTIRIFDRVWWSCCFLWLVVVTVSLVRFQRDWPEFADLRLSSFFDTTSQNEEARESVNADEQKKYQRLRRGIVGRHNWSAKCYFDDEKVVVACDAIYKGETGKLQSLIEEGLDVNVQGRNGLTLLHWAFACNELPCFQLLLDAGADPDVPLSQFVKSQDEFIFYTGDTIIHACARQTTFERYLIAALKYCKNPDRPGAGDDKVMNMVLRHGYSDNALRAVLDAGADPNVVESGQSAFVGFLIVHDYTRLKTLMEYHADPLYGSRTANRILELIDDRIPMYSDGNHARVLAVLTEFRQAVVKRDNERKNGGSPEP